MSGIGALVAALAALLAIIVAYPNWLMQQRYKAKEERALTILSAFYEGRQVFDHIRSPILVPAEIGKAEEIIAKLKAKPSEADHQRSVQKFVTYLRIDEYQEYWEKILTLLPMTRAVFGDQAETWLKDILKARKELYAAASMYPKTGEKNLEKLENKLWKDYASVKDEADPFDKLLNETQESLQNQMGPFFQPKVWWKNIFVSPV